MAGGGEKTEKPTPKKLGKARKQGQVAKSADFTSAIVLGGTCMMLTMYGPTMMKYLLRLLRLYLRDQLTHTAPLTLVTFISLMNSTIWHIITLLAPFLTGIMAFAIAANLYQVRPLFAPAVLHPNLGKLNPISGFKRLFTLRSLIELVKGIVKMLVIGGVGYAIVYSERHHLLSFSQMGFMQAWALAFKYIVKITFANFIMLLILGIVDYKYQKWQFMKQMRMTKQEVKDEYKNSEGNPQVKRKVRETGQSMIRQRMMKNIPLADVIVNNPTHISVAIQYDPDVCPAPRVVAKGADYLAFQIRTVAKEHGIPMVENVPLARSLYEHVEVEHMVPPHLFVAVAEVLAYVYRLNKGRGKRSRSWMKTGGVLR